MESCAPAEFSTGCLDHLRVELPASVTVRGPKWDVTITLHPGEKAHLLGPNTGTIEDLAHLFVNRTLRVLPKPTDRQN